MVEKTASSSQFKVSKNSSAGTGTTFKIREQLNFKDDRKWKQFSGRRLELIDKFGLSNKKASEQDDNIRQIATILRTEFNYPVSYSVEFEKLVTAAVQSVRRNRKRSKKNLLTPNNSKNTSTAEVSSTPPSDDDANSLHSVSSSRVLSPLQTPKLTPISFTINPSLPNSSKQFQLPNIQPKMNQGITLDMKNKMYSSNVSKLALSSSSSSSSSSISNSNQSLVKNENSTQNNFNPYNDIIKSTISEIVNNVIPLSEQLKNDSSDTPNLSDFALSTQDHNLLAISAKNNLENKKSKREGDNSTLPGFLRENILVHIQRSRTCSELAASQGSIDIYTNLELLGEMSIKSAITFVIERFFSNISQTSMQYISTKTMSKGTLASLSLSLFNSATNHNLITLPVEQVQIKLLYYLLGGIIKDFGFDPILYPLSEIIHHIVIKQYPLESNSQSGSKNLSTNTPFQQSSVSTAIRTALLSTTSMKPQQANEDINRKVILKFKENQQLFTFPLLSNGTPTINEILENCRSLFNIVQKSELLGIFYENQIIVEDNELVRLFNSFPTNNEILLEIKDKGIKEYLPKLNSIASLTNSINSPRPSPPPDQLEVDGLKMLSAVSLGIKEEDALDSQKASRLIHIPNTSISQNVKQSESVTKLDNIISRIGSESAIKPSSSKPNLTGSFKDGNLPQPVFQPLL